MTWGFDTRMYCKGTTTVRLVNTVVTTLFFRFPELVYLITESLCPLINISLSPYSQASDNYLPTLKCSSFRTDLKSSLFLS